MGRSQQKHEPLAKRSVGSTARVGVVWLLAISLLCCGFSLSYDCHCSCCQGLAQTAASDLGCECCGQGAEANCCCCDELLPTASKETGDSQDSSRGCECNSRVDVRFDLSGVDFAIVATPKVFVKGLGRPVCNFTGIANSSVPVVAESRFGDGRRKYLLYCVWLI